MLYVVRLVWPPSRALNGPATVINPSNTCTGSAGSGSGDGPATTAPWLAGSYSEPWQGQWRREVCHPDTAHPACGQMTVNATTSSLLSITTRRSSTWLKRAASRTTPLFRSIGQAITGAAPRFNASARRGVPGLEVDTKIIAQLRPRCPIGHRHGRSGCDRH